MPSDLVEVTVAPGSTEAPVLDFILKDEQVQVPIFSTVGSKAGNFYVILIFLCLQTIFTKDVLTTTL